MRNSLRCFGVGDGWSCADRGHSSFLYGLGRQSLLIDCGEPIDGRLEASGLGHNRFDAIFLSHLHADHFGGLFMLLQGCWLSRRRKSLPIYLPAGAIRPLGAMLRTAYLFQELLPFQLGLKPLQDGRGVRVGAACVTPHSTTHLAGFRRRFGAIHKIDYRSYAFVIESGGVRVGHSADLGRPEDLAPLLAKPLDLLVCELAHFDPDDLFAYLAGKSVGQIVFVHLSRELWEHPSRIRRLASRRLKSIPHLFATDGAVIGF